MNIRVIAITLASVVACVASATTNQTVMVDANTKLFSAPAGVIASNNLATLVTLTATDTATRAWANATFTSYSSSSGVSSSYVLANITATDSATRAWVRANASPGTYTNTQINGASNSNQVRIADGSRTAWVCGTDGVWRVNVDAGGFLQTNSTIIVTHQVITGTTNPAVEYFEQTSGMDWWATTNAAAQWGGTVADTNTLITLLRTASPGSIMWDAWAPSGYIWTGTMTPGGNPWALYYVTGAFFNDAPGDQPWNALFVRSNHVTYITNTIVTTNTVQDLFSKVISGNPASSVSPLSYTIITNSPWLLASAIPPTAYRYQVCNTSGYEIWVDASWTGITATVSSGVATFAIPAGTVLHSARLRCPDSSLVVDTGTNDMANTSLANRWGCSGFVAYREDTGSKQNTATIALDLYHASKVIISGLTGGGVTSQIDISW